MMAAQSFASVIEQVKSCARHDAHFRFAEVPDRMIVTQASEDCVRCGKRFTAGRMRRMSVRLYPLRPVKDTSVCYSLCGPCSAMYRRGGDEREAVLAAVQAFHLGEGSPCA